MKRQSHERRFEQNSDALATMRAFASQFIQTPYAERWTHLLCERPEKAYAALHRLERQLIPEVCRRVSGAADRDGGLLSTFGNVEGFYFDGLAPARLCTLAAVLQELGPYQEDAVFVARGGSKAIVFHHDGFTWVCKCGPA